jgi:hypothetical protein
MTPSPVMTLRRKQFQFLISNLIFLIIIRVINSFQNHFAAVDLVGQGIFQQLIQGVAVYGTLYHCVHTIRAFQ